MIMDAKSTETPDSFKEFSINITHLFASIGIGALFIGTAMATRGCAKEGEEIPSPAIVQKSQTSIIPISIPQSNAK